jgi:adenylate cyclase
MRQRGLSRHLPLVVVSAWDESERAAYCIKLGADDYIKKPVVECLLHARVKSCLAKARRRRAELERFFPSDVARQLLENPEALDVGQEAEVTVLFSDIRNFSSVSARLGAKKTVEWVRDIMTTLSECVIRHGGTLVNYVGDEVMAVWGAPMATDDHAWQACQAALEMREERGPLTERWEKVIGQPVRFGVGVNTGPVQIGNIGTKRKFQYGPLGDTVNVASRVQGATKFVRQPLLITRATYDAVGPSFPARRVASVRMVNIPDPVSVFEPAPMSKTGGWIDLRWAYEDALLAFEEMRFAKCVQTLGSLLGRFPEDGPARLLLARASACLADPPPPDEFDPTWDFKQK